jgi:hypothetical protein
MISVSLKLDDGFLYRTAVEVAAFSVLLFFLDDSVFMQL